MTLEWMKKQAGWVIGIFGVFILGGLVMMDRAGSYRQDRHHNVVGKVDGEEIPTERFQAELKNYLQGQQAQTGRAGGGLSGHGCGRRGYGHARRHRRRLRDRTARSPP